MTIIKILRVSSTWYGEIWFTRQSAVYTWRKYMNRENKQKYIKNDLESSLRLQNHRGSDIPPMGINSLEKRKMNPVYSITIQKGLSNTIVTKNKMAVGVVSFIKRPD